MKPTIDFDHYSRYYRDHWPEIAREFHSSGRPIAWTTAHGGFWLVGSWKACQEIGDDWETFTSVNDLDGTDNGGMGQVIPRAEYRLFLGESDPPLHTERRRLEAPFFTPKAVREWTPVAHKFLDEAIDAVVEKGSADLIEDILIPTTARTTLYVVGYDPNEWRDAALSAHTAVYLLHDDPEYPHAEQDRLRRGFRKLLQDRRSAPTGDLVSSLAQGLVQGAPLSDEEGESMINILVLGGFDTTTALVANALIWLQDHPNEAERVRTDEAYRKNAVEEFLRVFPPANILSRTATRDTELLGQPIAKGERVGMWFPGANRDPSVFENPEEVRLDRPNARDNVSFSVGGHRCLGAPLAKAEASVLLETILTRLEDLKIDRDALVRYPSYGTNHGYVNVPATFTPGRPGATDIA